MRTTNQRMMGRKMLILMGAAALVAGTLACGGDEATDTTAPPSTPESVAQEETGGSVDQEAAATGAGHAVTVTEVAAPSELMSDVTLYAPDADGSWPVTVLFAGWDSARSTLDPLARALAAEGVVVATTEIGSDEEVLAGEYECSQRLAVLSAWEHGADPDAPIAVGGHDMGAGMALMASAFDPFTSLATGRLLDCGLEGEDDLPPMDLLIGLGGVWTPGECDGMSGDGPAAQDSRADVSDGFAGYVAWADSNPSAPILMAHGTADPVCSIEVARAAADELEANGHPVELLVFEGGGHAGGMLFLDDENDAAAASADPDAAEGREVVTAIVAALSAASASGSEGQESASMEVDTVVDLEYLSTETESFELDVYQPDGDGPYPVIVLFHGATAEGKGSSHAGRMAEALAASGLVVFAPTWNAEFTTLTGDGWLKSADRASCALAYAEEHAADHGGDPSALATFGWSAGAHPAAWLALGHGTPGEGCVVDSAPNVPNGAVLIDSEYFLHSSYFQRMFDNDAEAASGIVAGFVDPTAWAANDEATFRLAAAEIQGTSVRSIGDPTSWLAQRDVDGSLTADLERLGALDDGQVDYIDEARLLQLRLERSGFDATFTTVTGDHTDAVGPTNDAILISAALEATGAIEGEG